MIIVENTPPKKKIIIINNNYCRPLCQALRRGVSGTGLTSRGVAREGLLIW